MVDVERGEVLLKYDNCAYSGRDRTGLATHPACPNMAVCVAVNGNGLTLLDLRMPLPLDFFYDVRFNFYFIINIFFFIYYIIFNTLHTNVAV